MAEPVATILDHPWRSPHGGRSRQPAARLDRLCAYMNCQRPRAEHARSTSGGWR